MAAGWALKGTDRVDWLAGGAVGHQDTMSAVETKAVSAGQEQRVLKELQTDWAGQLRLQCFHLHAKQSGVDSEIQGS